MSSGDPAEPRRIARAKSTAFFRRPFRLPGLNELLAAGEYPIETELEAPAGSHEPDRWRASVLIHLPTKAESPGLVRTLTVPHAELEQAQVEDRLSGAPLAEVLLAKLLADPMVQLVMASDSVTEAQIRRSFFGLRAGREPSDDQ
jgi:hypothetical protein